MIFLILIVLPLHNFFWMLGWETRPRRKKLIKKLIITVRMGLITMSSADNCVISTSGNYISQLIGEKNVEHASVHMRRINYDKNGPGLAPVGS